VLVKIAVTAIAKMKLMGILVSAIMVGKGVHVTRTLTTVLARIAETANAKTK
jgi:hypothetical protein